MNDKPALSSALVTGASGFIGRHLVSRLSALGVEVRCIVRSKGKFQTPPENAVLFEGDLSDVTILKEAVTGADAVFHFAGKAHDFSGSKESAEEHFRVNVEGTRNLLEACIGTGVKHFVYLSSIKAMTEESSATLDEDAEPDPRSPYGKSKLMAERLLPHYGQAHGFKTTSLRLPLVYGPGNKGNIYRMIKAIDRGYFVMLGRGENKRSMVYVGNVVDAALTVIGKDEADGKVYIVTDGTDYSVKALCDTIAGELGKRLLPFHMPMGIAKAFAIVGDIVGKPLPLDSEMLGKLTGSLTFSSQKIQEELGFRPKYNLYSAITETVKWYRSAGEVATGRQRQ